MTQSKPKKVILENDPLYKEKNRGQKEFNFYMEKKLLEFVI